MQKANSQTSVNFLSCKLYSYQNLSFLYCHESKNIMLVLHTCFYSRGFCRIKKILNFSADSGYTFSYLHIATA